MRDKPKFITIDVEATGLNPRKDVLHGIGIGYEEDVLKYYSAPIADKSILALLADKDVPKVGHNLRFDIKFLSANGIEVAGKIWDTMLMAQMLNENGPQGLKELVEQHLGDWALEHKREVDRLTGKHRLRHVGELAALHLASIEKTQSYDEAYAAQELGDAIAAYCKEDCNNTYKLFVLFSKKLRAVQKTWRFEYQKQNTPLEYLTKEMMPTEEMLAKLELRGLNVDMEKVSKYKEELSSINANLFTLLNKRCAKEIAAIEGRLYEEELDKRKSEAGKAKVEKSSEKYKTRFNWQSNDHLGDLFYNHLGYTCSSYTKSGKPSMSEKDVKLLPKTLIIQDYQAMKKNQKLLSTYTGEKKGLVANLEDGKVYAEYPQKTVTGRLASRKPNMQNLPRGPRVREFFIPDSPDKAFIYFDYSQLELRVAAHLSRDAKMVAAYNEGKDLHEITAFNAGVDRQLGKKVNFAMIYNASAWRLKQELDHLSIEECEQLRQDFFATYYGYAQYLKNQTSFMRRTGTTISELGRVRRLPLLMSAHERSKEFRGALNQGYNFPIQSLGASITKQAMCELHDIGFDLVTQVHDSVIIQVSKDKTIIENSCAIIKDVAESVYKLCVPLKVDMKVLNSMSEEDVIDMENIESNDSGYSKGETREQKSSKNLGLSNGSKGHLGSVGGIRG